MGADHPEVASSTLHRVGVVSCEAGKTEKAEGYPRRALAICEQTLSADDLDAIRSLYQLGVCANEAGRLEEVQRYYRRALSNSEKLFGADHPSLVDLLRKLGAIAYLAGKLEEAEGHYVPTYSGDPGGRLGRRPPGRCAQKQGRKKAAEGLFRRALVITEEQLGPDHPCAVDTRETLAELYTIGEIAIWF